jgi:flagellar assembly factor FliW
MSTMTTTECEMPTAPAEATVAPASLHLPLGLLGFETVKHYAVLQNPEEHPFLWLRMTEPPNHAFLALPPAAVLSDYRPELSDEDVAFLQLASPEDAVILNIVTLRNGGSATVNLKGPVVYNRHTRVAKQVIPINAARFTLQHPLPAIG